MAEQDLDRNQAATPYKLQRARERGQTAKSTDVVGALVFAVAVIYLSWQGMEAVTTQFRFDLALLIQAGRMDAEASLWPLIDRALRMTLGLVAPFFGAVMVAAVVGNMMQTGPILSFDPVKADFNRINPVNGRVDSASRRRDSRCRLTALRGACFAGALVGQLPPRWGACGSTSYQHSIRSSPSKFADRCGHESVGRHALRRGRTRAALD